MRVCAMWIETSLITPPMQVEMHLNGMANPLHFLPVQVQVHGYQRGRLRFFTNVAALPQKIFYDGPLKI